MIGKIRTVFDRFLAWRAVKVISLGASVFASDGTRFTIQ